MADPNPTAVILTPNVPSPTRDENVALYNSIRNCSENLSFNTYTAFLTALFCKEKSVSSTSGRAGFFIVSSSTPRISERPIWNV